jgi:uncharacterized oligopeptide transporter (OPT) family protein
MHTRVEEKTKYFTAAGGLGILFVGAIPAMYRLHLLSDLPQKDIGKLIAITVCAGFFGVFFVIPLRKYYIVHQKLTFPTPAATVSFIFLLSFFYVLIFLGVHHPLLAQWKNRSNRRQEKGSGTSVHVHYCFRIQSHDWLCTRSRTFPLRLSIISLNTVDTAVRLARWLDSLQTWFHQYHLVGQLWMVYRM